jgi:hypothetical protein
MAEMSTAGGGDAAAGDVPVDPIVLLARRLDAIQEENRAALERMKLENQDLLQAHRVLQERYDALHAEARKRSEDPVQILAGESGVAAAYLCSPSKWAQRMRDVAPVIPTTSAAWRPRPALPEVVTRPLTALSAAWRRRGDVSVDGEFDPVRDAPRASELPAGVNAVSLEEFARMRARFCAA